ncbi:MAG: hypothetical protein K2L18_03510 [Acetatifactor sp.]|nr:hypothetical protein [Acetatifactor sp.]
MRGKEKCKALKEIRRQIAEENDIPFVVSQCTHQGDCKGTCPKCESELRYLERELAIRQGLGKAVAVVGISASVCGGLTACSPAEMFRDGMGIDVEETAGVATLMEEELDGDIALPEIEGLLEAPPDSEQGGEAEPPEEEPESGSGNACLPEENGESQSMDEALAGAIPFPEELESVVMGEILPPPEVPENPDMELQGDIALPEAETAGSDESASPLGETAP